MTEREEALARAARRVLAAVEELRAALETPVTTRTYSLQEIQKQGGWPRGARFALLGSAERKAPRAFRRGRCPRCGHTNLAVHPNGHVYKHKEIYSGPRSVVEGWCEGGVAELDREMTP